MRIVSGIRVSGELHIGNYLGALKQWVELQGENDVYAFIADLHAITTPYEPKKLQENILKTAAMYIACGLDPNKAKLFLQSTLPQHSELAWLFETITPMGELNRMTQYKEKVQEGDPANTGLFAYPVLMAADILLYKAEAVPVGEDQVQHIELTRAIADKFNKKFGKTFPLPKEILPAKGMERLKSLKDPSKKMSKSDDSTSFISLFDSPEMIRKKLKSAVTDSGKEIVFDPKKKLAISNLLVIASGFFERSIKELEKEFSAMGYGDFKMAVADIVIEKLQPIQEKYKKLMQNPEHLKKVLAEGKEKAEPIASTTLKEVKQKMGLLESISSH